MYEPRGIVAASNDYTIRQEYRGPQATVWQRLVNSSNVKVNSGHLIPLEAPLELGVFSFSAQDGVESFIILTVP
ncbi:hypothetical protein BS47DRAFT_1397673 [Hydnum rufescens UP504]|uniref:Uncharacterized protein n=1 Tax=Hydnum rufescens UP504 TaxID=1448309 RepID=A0A9P6DSG8_9AGAM|nr:hypothetical protein BS47DRAFT_1397673 [Hydnum rufescens UP504]